MKPPTLKQLEARKEEAERIAQEARDDADRADYALQKATLENRKTERKNPMPIKTRRELIEENEELAERVEELESRLAEIGQIATPEDEDDEDEEEGDRD